MENDEKKYKDVINALRNLQEVKAPANFEADLQRRINSEKFSKEEKKSFWQNIFVPAKLIPSFGLVAAAVVIFFVVETNSEEMDNPFLIEPRIREDVIEVTDYLDLQKKQEEIPKQKSSKKDEPVLEKRRDESELKSSEDKMITGREKSSEIEGLLDAKDVPEDQDINAGAYFAAESTVIVDSLAAPQPTTATVTSSELVTGQAITKEELNFRQVQLSKEEQKVVNELKTQVQSLDNVNKTQK
ncbi:MAG: hypothetical protein WBN42_13185 [Ignavibacteriaceae bacterium]